MANITNWLITKEVAELLNIKHDTVRKLAERDELTYMRLHRKFIMIADDEKLAAAKIKAAAGGFKCGGLKKRG
jgi:excisionase family DNA binding protein